MSKLLPKEMIEQLIEYLATTYPKTFFTSAHLKRPLKRNIIVDLEKDNRLDDEKREAAVSFYTRDWNYERTLQAGARRIDLNGNEVGTVTEQEHIEAQRRVQAARQALKERDRQAGPLEVVRKLHAAGRVPTDSLSKVSVPTERPAMAKSKTTSESSPPAPQNGVDLAELRALWGSIDSMLAGNIDASLHAAVAAAALKIFVGKAGKLIATLEEKSNGRSKT
jgi:sRNA-binding protein